MENFVNLLAKNIENSIAMIINYYIELLKKYDLVFLLNIGSDLSIEYNLYLFFSSISIYMFMSLFEGYKRYLVRKILKNYANTGQMSFQSAFDQLDLNKEKRLLRYITAVIIFCMLLSFSFINFNRIQGVIKIIVFILLSVINGFICYYQELLYILTWFYNNKPENYYPREKVVKVLKIINIVVFIFILYYTIFYYLLYIKKMDINMNIYVYNILHRTLNIPLVFYLCVFYFILQNIWAFKTFFGIYEVEKGKIKELYKEKVKEYKSIVNDNPFEKFNNVEKEEVSNEDL